MCDTLASMQWAFTLAMGASGCSSILGIDDFKLVDASVTSELPLSIDAAPGCFGPAGFFVCLDPLPAPPVRSRSEPAVGRWPALAHGH